MRISPWLRWVCLGAFWCSLFVGTHLPRIPGVISRAGRDKVLHFTAYALLALLLMWVFSSASRPFSRLWWRRALLIWLGLAVYGAVDEVLQIPVGRSCEFGDWLADISGGGVAILGYGVISLGTAMENDGSRMTNDEKMTDHE